MYSLHTRFGGLYWRLASLLLCGYLAGSRHHRDRHHLPASMQGYQQVSATPYRKTAVRTSPGRSGISEFLNFSASFGATCKTMVCISSCSPSAVGTLTGLLITRNVTRRLRRITQAAEAWSKGEFAVEVRDPTRDEIGQLGQDLNSMAEQLPHPAGDPRRAGGD